MKISFSKMSGCGNDFVLIDNRECALKSITAKFIQNICHRYNGVGADGLILIEKSDNAVFRMRFYNADGGEAEMCGNGARCVSRFAYLSQIAKDTMVFETKAGNIEGRVLQDGRAGDEVKVLNTTSGKEVLAIVEGPGLVSVSF